jgi:hypothetical protein
MKSACCISLIAALCSGCVINVRTDIRDNTFTAAPPQVDSGTIILFDGSKWSGWHQRDGSPSQWLMQDDGSVQVHGGDAITDEEFGDFQLHIEFLCPPTSDKAGQSKSNSGVYLHGRYEVQVLDSYGDAPANNLCGGIYQIAAPLVNASRPAGCWQTFDIVFRAPRMDEQGKVIEQPRITVAQNGVTIHNNIILPHATPGGLDQTMPATGPILLQDHGDPVRYRNIWIRRL